MCLLWMSNVLVEASNLSSPENETWNYSIRYKYGLVVMKAGTANYRLQTANYKGNPALKSSLNLKTNPFFDKIFLLRDTLMSYSTLPDFHPLYHHRTVHEGNTHFKEEIRVQKFGEKYTELHIKRIQDEKIRIDTLLTMPNAGYDVVNIFLYLRQLNYSDLNPGDNLHISTFLGKKKANLIIRYVKPVQIERSNKQQRKAFHLTIDVSNEVFSEAKNAMEVWISDDEYHIPLKIKAKLKIGAMEADLM